MTPYAKLFCKQHRQPLLMFAETVIARKPGAQVNKLEHQWLEGLWIGRDSSTDEHLVASGGGIVRCRAVKRMTEDRRWLAVRFGSFQWTPWAPAAVQRGRPPRARKDAEPIRVGALGREHLLMALLQEHLQHHQQQLLNQQCGSPRRRMLHSPVLLLRLLHSPVHLLRLLQRRRLRWPIPLQTVNVLTVPLISLLLQRLMSQ